MKLKLDTKSFVFSAREDITVFLFLPLLFALGIYFLYLAFGLKIDQINPLSYFFIYILFDDLHVYLSLSMATGFTNEFKRRFWFYILFPVIAFFIYFLLFNQNAMWMYRLYAYISVFHFGRQQIGWMRLTAKQGQRFFEWERHLEDIVIYSSTWGFILYKVTSHQFPQWFVPGDLGVSHLLSPLLVLACILAVNLIFLFSQFFIFFKTGYCNLARILIWLTTLAVWGIAFYAFDNFNVVSLALIVFLHSPAYMLLAFYYIKMRKIEGHPTYIKGSYRKIYISFIVAALLLACGEYVAGEYPQLFGPQFAAFIVVPLLATMTSFHHTLDTFFWREKLNPGCLKFKGFIHRG